MDEWTSVKNVGREYGGVVPTRGEYRRVEQAYIDSAFAFLSEGGLTSLRVEGLENHNGLALKISEGAVVSIEEIGDLVRQILREEFWCRLEARGGFVH